ncbi:MAG: hypothetical protein D6785_13485, partial [Planctomycetota bacterium]
MGGPGYITLLEALDYLEANGFLGRMDAFDRESHKTFLFTKDGIYVSSKGHRKGMRLIEILRREGNLDRQVLEDALADERESNFQKSLGEILVAQGEISQKVLDIKLKLIVEDEFYDLFLWGRAKYTFDPSATVEKTFPSTIGVTYFKTNTINFCQNINKSINEWNLNPQWLPDLPTVFVMDDSQFGRLKDLGLTRKMIQESQLFSENSLAEILSKTSLSKPELCHLLFTLLRERIIYFMDFEQAKQKGIEEEQKGNLGKAATFFTYYLFYSQQLDFSIMDKLILLLEKENRRHDASSLMENIGWGLYENGKFTNACQVAQLILKYFPGHQGALSLEFNCHAQLANADMVKQVGESLGNLLVVKKKYKKAIDHYQYLIQWFPEDLAIQAALADCYIKNNQHQEGLKILGECARTYLEKNNKKEALRIYRMILDVDPQREDIRKKVAAMQRAQLIKKLIIVGVPCLVLVIIGIVFWMKLNTIRTQEIKASQLLSQARKLELALPSLIDVKKEVASGGEKAIPDIKAKFINVVKLYDQILQKYKQTKASSKALARKQHFLEKWNLVKKFLDEAQKRFIEQRERAKKKRKEQEDKLNMAQVAKIEGYRLLKKGEIKKAIQSLKESFQHYIEFYQKYPDASDLIYSPAFKLPMLIDSIPRGAEVYEGDKAERSNFLGKTPLIFEYGAKREKLVFTFKAKGFKQMITDKEKDSQWLYPPLKWDRFNVLRPTLNMKPIAFTNLPLGPVETSFLLLGKDLVFGARDGIIYSVRFYSDSTRLNWVDKNSGSFGDFFSDPVEVKKLFFIGNTSGEMQGFAPIGAGKFKKIFSHSFKYPILASPNVYQYPS